MSVVLLNAETEQPVLYLDGIERASHAFDAVVTNHPLSDGSQRTDGRQIRPRLMSLSGTVGAFFSRDGQLLGDERVDEVVGILRELQVSATRLVVQMPGRAPIESMQIERFSEDFDASENPPITVDLKETRTASRRQILLEPIGASTGAPREEFAAGLEEAEERGTLPNKSLSAAGIDGVLGLLGLGG
jgi:hypothetical protein